MEAACQRLCQGDTSSLVDVLNCLDARKSDEVGRLGTEALGVILNILVQEGVELRRSQDSEYQTPTGAAFFALRILSQLGVRQTEDGLEVQRALLLLGLQRCRDLCLDAYFSLARWQRYHVITFVKLLMAVYGCLPLDLLQKEASISMVNGSVETHRVAAHPTRTTEGEDGARTGNRQSGRGTASSSPQTTATTRGSSSGAAPAAGAGAAAPQTAPSTEHTAPSSRRSNIQNRSTLFVTVPGASFDLPFHPTRRYRELPRKPINAPFAVNPLYESVLSNKIEAFASPSTSLLPAERLAVAETVIPAQFPTPVVLFASYYGVGCVPCLPTTDGLARLEAWRERLQQSTAAKSGAPPSRKDRRPSLEHDAEATRSPAVINSNPTPSTSTVDAEPPQFQVHNERSFLATNTATATYNHQCTQSPLLEQYVEQGKLLSWGSLAKGALGPLRQRDNRIVPSASELAVLLEPSPMGKASGRSSGGGGIMDSKLHGSAKSMRSSGGVDGNQRSGSGKSKHKSATPPPESVKRSKGGTPVPEELQGGAGAARGGGTAVSTQVTITSATGGSFASTTMAAASSSPNDADGGHYVYLPLPVHTSLRAASIACGLSVTYVVTVDGALYSCGRADNGQLGMGERTTRYAESGSSRFQRVLLKESESVTRVEAGTACAVALEGEQALYCWGHNVYGQCLKMPDVGHVLTPVRLKTSTYKVLDICFGQFFGVLLFDDGMMGTWGIASMLGCSVGDKELQYSLAPDQCKCARQVVHLELGTSTPMAAVRAGPWHALAISKGGEVYTWGVGRGGRLGHGSDAAEITPRLVEGLRSCFAIDASCASAHSAVLTSTGRIYVFGDNIEGQLGLRGRSPRRVPAMMPLPGKAVAVSCAREHTCVLLADGDVVACGSYRTSGVGLGFGSRFCAPRRILTNYVTLTMRCGHFHSLAGVVHRRTAVMLVGHSTIDEVSQVSSLVVRNGVRCAVSGVGFLIVLSENNTIVSIGRGERGQLGIGDCMKPTHPEDVTVTPKFTEVRVPDGVVIQHLSCGPDFVVALGQDGAVYGWGCNDHRKLCQPAGVAHVFAPVRIGGYFRERVVQMACGGTFVIALTADGKVLAHGEAMYCGFGDGVKGDVSSPTHVTALRGIVSIAAGRRHAIAMTSSCNVFAWGLGVLGSSAAKGSSTPSAAAANAFAAVATTPVRVTLSQNIRSIGCGPHNSFAITEEGELWVWGVNRYGECGVPPNREGDSGRLAKGSYAVDVTAGGGAVGASVVLSTPVSVARQVRDAAFTGQFGLIVFEDGQVRVSGRVRYAGRKFLLSSFHHHPQPPFSVDVNEPPPRRFRGDQEKDEGKDDGALVPNDAFTQPGKDTPNGAGVKTISPAPPSISTSAAAASSKPSPSSTAAKPQCGNVTQVVSLDDDDEEDKGEPRDDDDNFRFYNSPSASETLEPTTTSLSNMHSPSRVRHEGPARRSATGTSATASSSGKASPHPASDSTSTSSKSSHNSAESPSASAAVNASAMPSPTATTPQLHLPPAFTTAVQLRNAEGTADAIVAATTAAPSTHSQVGNSMAERSTSRLMLGEHRGSFATTGTTTTTLSDQASVSDSTLLPASTAPSLIPEGTVAGGWTRRLRGAHAAVANAAAAAVSEQQQHTTYDFAAVLTLPTAYLYDHRSTSPNVSIDHNRSFPEPDDGGPPLPRLPKVSAAPQASAARESQADDAHPPASARAASAESPPQLPPFPPPYPPTHAPPGRVGMATNVAETARGKTRGGKQTTAEKRSASAPKAAVASPPAAASKESVKGSGQTTAPRRVSITETPPIPRSDRIFGIRCFGGWEQICAVMEKHRPSEREVRMAQVGLQLLIHQPRNEE